MSVETSCIHILILFATWYLSNSSQSWCHPCNNLTLHSIFSGLQLVITIIKSKGFNPFWATKRLSRSCNNREASLQRSGNIGGGLDLVEVGAPSMSMEMVALDRVHVAASASKAVAGSFFIFVFYCIHRIKFWILFARTIRAILSTELKGSTKHMNMRTGKDNGAEAILRWNSKS